MTLATVKSHMLADPGLDRVIQQALNGLSYNTRDVYERNISRFISFTNGAPINRQLVKEYVAHLLNEGMAPSSVNQHLSAIRSLLVEAGDNGLEWHVVQSITSISNIAVQPVRTHRWLSKEEVRVFIPKRPPINGLLRDWQQHIALSLLVGCGLRRAEVASMEWKHLVSQNGRWLIHNLVGKGSKKRSVPVPNWVASSLGAWLKVYKSEYGKVNGLVVCSVLKGDRAGSPGVTPKTIYNIVKERAAEVGMSDLTPHDLRRTWARRLYDMGTDIKQIALVLGHSSVTTTEIYLGLTGVDLDAIPEVEY